MNPGVNRHQRPGGRSTGQGNEGAACTSSEREGKELDDISSGSLHWLFDGRLRRYYSQCSHCRQNRSQVGGSSSFSWLYSSIHQLVVCRHEHVRVEAGRRQSRAHLRDRFVSTD